MTVPVPEDELPVTLPTDVTVDASGSPLKKLRAFIDTTCPGCGGPAERETDTFDTFFESSWYYARYACADQDQAMLDSRADYWLPVDQYIGGIEHAVLHLLYARFFNKLMRDEGLLKPDEPFTCLLTQGMVLKDGSKMSKSRGNTVDPQGLIDRYGADTVRLFTMFAAPPDQSLEWADSGVEGASRFLKRLWDLGHKRKSYFYPDPESVIVGVDFGDPANWNWEGASARQLERRRHIHILLKKANDDFNRHQFNTVVSAGMQILNNLQVAFPVAKEVNNPDETEGRIEAQLQYEGLGILLRLLSPIIPHITHKLWYELGYRERVGVDVLDAGWPEVDESALVQDTLTLAVQVNGKLRGTIAVAADADREAIGQAAQAEENVARHIDDRPVKKIIVVPGRLVNIVI